MIAEAEALYREYTKVASQIAIDGGKDAERIRPYLGATEYGIEKAAADQLAAKGYHTEGRYVSSNFTPQVVEVGSGEVRAYICLDASKARTVDRNDRAIAPKGAVSKGTLIVSFKRTGSNLRIEGSEAWSGQSVC